MYAASYALGALLVLSLLVVWYSHALEPARQARRMRDLEHRVGRLERQADRSGRKAADYAGSGLLECAARANDYARAWRIQAQEIRESMRGRQAQTRRIIP